MHRRKKVRLSWWIGAILYVAAVQQCVTPIIAQQAAPQWAATAYCKGTHTFFGTRVRRGMAASDPKVLPIGSIVRVTGTGEARFDGVYSVHDTGPAIQGHILDLYMWSCYEALDFGRRKIEVEVLRRGWLPNAEVER